MAVLSPLLQTSEIKQKIIDERDELHRRATCGYKDADSIGHDDEIKTLSTILAIINNPETYRDKVAEGWSNHSIADKLQSLLILSEDEAFKIKNNHRVKKAHKRSLTHI